MGFIKDFDAHMEQKRFDASAMKNQNRSLRDIRVQALSLELDLLTSGGLFFILVVFAGVGAVIGYFIGAEFMARFTSYWILGGAIIGIIVWAICLLSLECYEDGKCCCSGTERDDDSDYDDEDEEDFPSQL